MICLEILKIFPVLWFGRPIFNFSNPLIYFWPRRFSKHRSSCTGILRDHRVCGYRTCPNWHACSSIHSVVVCSKRTRFAPCSHGRAYFRYLCTHVPFVKTQHIISENKIWKSIQVRFWKTKLFQISLLLVSARWTLERS